MGIAVTPFASPALSAVGLRKAFGPLIVLDDIDLEVPTGTMFSLLGPNGCLLYTSDAADE